MPTLLPLWRAARTTGKQCGLTATGDYQPSLRSPWLAAKVNDRDGLYVAVTPAGTISFRHNYSLSGRQETLTIGRYGSGGITLAEARERLNEAKKM